MGRNNRLKIDQLKGTSGFTCRLGDPYEGMLQDLQFAYTRGRIDMLRWLIRQDWNLLPPDQQHMGESEATNETPRL